MTARLAALLHAEVLDRYFARAEQARAQAAPAKVEFSIEASLPRLRKRGTMKGLKVTSKDGIHYSDLRFSGDATIKTAVIARYLAAEQGAGQDGEDVSISPANYKFQYKRTEDYNGRTGLVYAVEPKRKRVGYFRGELWIDAESGQTLREWGRLVKSPSLFVSRISFVRDYLIERGRSLPRRILVTVRTFLVGTAELTVWLGAHESPESESGGPWALAQPE